ncbi:MAG: hypothetical protein ACLTKE_09000 [Coprococcus sp.]
MQQIGFSVGLKDMEAASQSAARGEGELEKEMYWYSLEYRIKGWTQILSMMRKNGGSEWIRRLSLS